MKDTSLGAYRSVDLQQRERDVMLACHRIFPASLFTRKELAHAMGWEINRITGRVLTLIERGYLTEHEQTRDGCHLLSIASPKAAAAPAKASEAIPAALCPTEPASAAAPTPCYDRKDRLICYCEGYGPGWPADQETLHGRNHVHSLRRSR